MLGLFDGLKKAMGGGPATDVAAPPESERNAILRQYLERVKRINDMEVSHLLFLPHCTLTCGG